MRVAWVAALVALSATVNGEAAQRWRDETLGLQPSTEFFNRVYFNHTPYALARFAVQKHETSSKYYPKTKARMLEDWRTYLEKGRVLHYGGGVEVEESMMVGHKLARKFQRPAEAVLGSIDFVGGETLWFLNDEFNPPARFVLHEDVCAVVFDRLGYPVELNTLKFTAKERATRVLESVILPSLSDAKPVLDVSAIKHVGFVVSYGSKDFSDKSDLNHQGETLAVICPSASARAFLRMELSQEELVEACDTFLSDRDASMTVKKVRLELK